MHAALRDDESNLAASQADYVRALELAEPESFLGVFVAQGPPVFDALANLAKQNRLGTVKPSYVQRILAAFPKTRPRGTIPSEQPALGLPAGTKPAAPIEPLTDRELEVLRLIAQGQKYKEIATRLFISLNTVRFHVKGIYGKLDVNNRTRAVEKARQLRIL
jgi:LuxR family maltose regulon positive regulatory protein